VSEPTSPPAKRQPRWGWRLLGFLTLAALALITSMAQGYHTIGTLTCTIVGLLGAVWSTIRGMGTMGRVMDDLQGGRGVKRR